MQDDMMILIVKIKWSSKRRKSNNWFKIEYRSFKIFQRSWLFTEHRHKVTRNTLNNIIWLYLKNYAVMINTKLDQNVLKCYQRCANLLTNLLSGNISANRSFNFLVIQMQVLFTSSLQILRLRRFLFKKIHTPFKKINS